VGHVEHPQRLPALLHDVRLRRRHRRLLVRRRGRRRDDARRAGAVLRRLPVPRLPAVAGGRAAAGAHRAGVSHQPAQAQEPPAPEGDRRAAPAAGRDLAI
ncbi:MAG: hypothetical protein AVDCRST_MAG67-2515, partial [uncultured Solirubrobacteraceae bacterium]